MMSRHVSAMLWHFTIDHDSQSLNGEQVSGQVDQTAGMLDETAKEKGYALMCVAEPLGDCRIRVIEEVCNCFVTHACI